MKIYLIEGKIVKFITNAESVEADRLRERGFLVTDPKATFKHTQAEIGEMGLLGVYKVLTPGQIMEHVARLELQIKNYKGVISDIHHLCEEA